MPRYYFILAKTQNIAKMYFDTPYLRNIERNRVSIAYQEEQLAGLADANFLLGYGWRYYNSVNWLGIIEHHMINYDCKVIGDADHITPAEMRRFKAMEAGEASLPFYPYAEKEPVISITRNDLLIIDN